jgi:hypothetical protein
MKQILHIFLKDARHFWAEILFCVALLAAMVLLFPGQWPGNAFGGLGAASYSPSRSTLQLLTQSLNLFIPLSWVLLIARIVHTESLVGDRQFWLTRPYEWRKLIAAKLLFLLSFLYLPLLISHWLLLVEAGFRPLSYIPGMLYNLLLITIILILPLFSLATVTSSFARLILTLFGIFLFIAGLLILGSFVDIGDVSIPGSSAVQLALMLCLGGAAILVQYASRAIWLARLLLIAFPVLFLLIGACIPDGPQINRAFPLPPVSRPANVQLAYNPEPNIRHPATLRSAKSVLIAIPIQALGTAEGALIILDDIQVAIEAPDGSRWTSSWQNLYGNSHLPVDKHVTAEFKMPRAVYEKLRSQALSVHLTFAVTQAQTANLTSIPLPTQGDSVPDLGICWTDTYPAGTTNQAFEIGCRSALRDPQLTHAVLQWSDPRCNPAQTEPDKSVQGIGWRGSFDDSPAQFGLSAVRTQAFLFENTYRDPQHSQEPYPCPGSRVIFTQYSLVGRTQARLDLRDFHLPDLSLLNR